MRLKSLQVNLQRTIPKLLPPSDALSPQRDICELLEKVSREAELESIYAAMIKRRAHHDCFLLNKFIGVCSTLHRLDYAVLSFENTETPNVFVYNALIAACVECFSPCAALSLYVDMSRSEVSPTSFTYSSVIKACSALAALKFGQTLHGQIWRNGLVCHVYVQTALIGLYSNPGRMSDARKIFDGMPERDVFAWTTMVSSGVRAGDINYARKLFDQMHAKNTATWNCMIDGYSRLGDVNSAEELFNRTPEKDSITWTTMINCYARHKKYIEAIAVFDEMRSTGAAPDEVTMATVISACAHIGDLGLGERAHKYLVHNRLNTDVFIGSALVDMYAKCGNMERSLLVFFKLDKRNLFCWNAVIEGLAIHGRAGEALAMFDEMERENVRPNGVTFTSVLSACARGGLVGEGREMFARMIRDYCLRPSLVHYGCIVDLLSKAGFLDEALALVTAMELEPNDVIWCSLLGGCVLHKNIELARMIVAKLLIMGPNNLRYYIVLFNMLAQDRRWNEATQVRATMDVLRVRKDFPGFSRIELPRTHNSLNM